MRRVVLLALLLVAGCGGDTPSAPSGGSQTVTHRLTGTVTAEGAGTPIAGATVSIADGANAGRSTSTGGDGTFSLTGLTAASFTVQVSASGYRQGSRAVTLDRDVNLALALVAAGPTTWTVSGVVRDDSTGEPVAGASVSVQDGPNADKSGVTDSSGAYVLAGLLEGGFTLRASASGYRAVFQGVSLTENRTVEFSLTPEPGLGVGATIVFRTNNACPCTRGGNTINVKVDGNVVGSVSCDSASQSFAIAPGTYTMNACDLSGQCWDDLEVLLTANSEWAYVMSCGTGLSTSGEPPFKILR